eukprot:TRINITY_DN31579_c0_g1_i1.p1 TRINITY_DN31579_c0_g1~~TRINITY_DN31579_c0_g1_i1.p1  ORF type:complete len:276 (-),score=43.21 TRINITY_DN31579_c0_g1_i1:186-896(-)
MKCTCCNKRLDQMTAKIVNQLLYCGLHSRVVDMDLKSRSSLVAYGQGLRNVSHNTTSPDFNSSVEKIVLKQRLSSPSAPKSNTLKFQQNTAVPNFQNPPVISTSPVINTSVESHHTPTQSPRGRPTLSQPRSISPNRTSPPSLPLPPVPSPFSSPLLTANSALFSLTSTQLSTSASTSPPLSTTFPPTSIPPAFLPPTPTFPPTSIPHISSSEPTTPRSKTPLCPPSTIPPSILST